MSSDQDIKKAQDNVFVFRRMGGIDQAILQTDYEWQNLGKLDRKLWMALSCPIHGLEFDSETLRLLDNDGDGRIRANEVVQAVAWVCQRVAHPAKLCDGAAVVELSNLRDDTSEGAAIASAMRHTLKQHGNPDAPEIGLAEIDKTLAEVAGYPFNGDGIVPPESAAASADGEKLAEFIQLALAVAGGMRDATGKPGLDASLEQEFEQRVKAVANWREAMKNTRLPLGENTARVWDLLGRLAPKLEDYFYRCQLAAFAPEALAGLNEEKFFQETGEAAPFANVDSEALAKLPLARVSAQRELNWEQGVNPAWSDDLAEFRKLAAPLFPDGKTGKTLDENTWKAVWQQFSEYGKTLNSKPSYAPAPGDAKRVEVMGKTTIAEAPGDDPLKRNFVPIDPDAALDALTDEQIAWILDPKTGAAFAALVKMDLDAPSLASFQDLRKLALFHAHLYKFLMNFLSFMDFYESGKKAIFQTGTLYLDSRGCTLCVPVADVDSHALLAVPSHLCLIYCACTRKEEDGAERNETIAAALTQGTLAGLLDGRHGVFIDNDGKEWDTKIVRIIHNPVSIREAMWSPYIRIANMASEQIQKFISSREEAVTNAASSAVSNVATAATKPQEAKQGFDFAKGAGIFAALGLALSAVSAAFAYIAHSLAALGWWWPLALIMVFVCISGPSMALAWLKLRKRTLGPLLDASGWAVNKGAPINIAMGASLTSVGELPPRAKRYLDDPYSMPGKLMRRKWKIRFWLTVIIALLIACGAFVAWCYLFGEPVWLFKLRAFAGI